MSSSVFSPVIAEVEVVEEEEVLVAAQKSHRGRSSIDIC